MSCRINRPDRRLHLTTCTEPFEENACIQGGVHRRRPKALARKRHGDRRTQTDLAVDAHVGAVQLGQPGDQRQAEARPHVAPLQAAVDLAEMGDRRNDILFGDADSGVGHR